MAQHVTQLSAMGTPGQVQFLGVGILLAVSAVSFIAADPTLELTIPLETAGIDFPPPTFQSDSHVVNLTIPLHAAGTTLNGVNPTIVIGGVDLAMEAAALTMKAVNPVLRGIGTPRRICSRYRVAGRFRG